MTYMLDTNICIYAIKQAPPNVYKMLDEKLECGICISSITLAELEHGVSNSAYPAKNEEAIIKFTSNIPVIPFDTPAAMEYGRICAYLRRRGTPIGTMDMLISAHALALGVTLVTNNVREFERVPGLIIENWAETVTT